ncbi:DNA-3-methyladenine glycosylase 2 [Halotia wernerae UHCC 0503]|nr:DNA-3-methyladenine glycosylase 2 [Halotia wernerae UHCC 0503]
MQRVQVELLPVAPYNFDQALTYLRTSPSAVLENISEDGTYCRAVTINGSDMLISIRSTGTVEVPHLTLEIYGRQVNSVATAHVAQLVRRIFSLDEDLALFKASCSQDLVFRNLLERFYGLRPVLIADPYESLLWAIIGQQINVAFAYKLKLALVNLCGQRLCVGNREYPILPRVQDVAALDKQMLRACQFSSQKATYLISLSRAVESGRLNLEALRTLPYDEAMATLTGFKGVGRWTAEYVLMRGLGAPDIIPAADLGLRAIIGRAYGLGRTASEVEVRSLAEAWSNWRGWASFYWWLELQLEKCMETHGFINSSKI